MNIKDELAKLSPTAKKIIHLVMDHGGDMNHMDIVRMLPDVSEPDRKEAFQQCYASTLLWDTWPTAFNPVHSWSIGKGIAAELVKEKF